MTGNGKHRTYKNGDELGMVYEIVLHTLLLQIHDSHDGGEMVILPLYLPNLLPLYLGVWRT